MSKMSFAFLVLVGVLIFAAVTVFAQPGTPEDPLVSRSYVDRRIAELEARISALALQTPEAPAAPVTTTTTRELFQVVRAEPGTALIGHASTEVILRAGEATVIAGYNGIANITSGVDLMNGQAVPMNNLLIFPVDDGRGLRFHTTVYLMVKGDFHMMY